MSTSLTSAQFWMQYGYKPYEFVDGHVLRRPRLRLVESVVLLRLSALVEQYAAENDLGEVVSGAGFRLSERSIRTPHAAFITKSLWESVRYPYSPFPFAPTLVIDMAVEETSDAAHFQPYLAAGTTQVWALDTLAQQITVYMSQVVPQVYNVGDILKGDRVLAGFLLPVASLFPRSRHF